MTGWRLIGLGFAATVLVALAVLDSAAPASCTAPDEQREKGLHAQAGKGYTAILRAEPRSTCATEGLDAIARERCTVADRLASAGARDEARRAYSALLTVEPPRAATDCALTGLARLAR